MRQHIHAGLLGTWVTRGVVEGMGRLESLVVVARLEQKNLLDLVVLGLETRLNKIDITGSFHQIALSLSSQITGDK